MDEEMEVQSEIIKWLVKGMQLLSAKIWVQNLVRKPIVIEIIKET